LNGDVYPHEAYGFVGGLESICRFVLGVAASEKSTTLTLMHCWGAQRAPWVEEMLRDFSAANPGIEVNNVLVGCGTSGTELYEKFIALAASGTAPDVVMIHTLDMPALAETRAISPLDAFISRDKLDPDMWYPSEVKSAQWLGSTYGLPIRPGGDANGILFYNRDHLAEAGLDMDAPPQTWDEAEAVSKKLIKYEGDKLARAAFAFGAADFTPTAWLYGGGGALLSEDGRAVTFADEQGLEAVQAIRSILHLPYQTPGESGALIAGVGGVRAAFINGQLTMQLVGSFEFSALQSAGSNVNLGVAAQPRHPASPYANAHGGTYVYAMASTSKEQEAAWQLIKWLTIEEQSAGYFMLRQQRPSPIRRFNQNREYLRINPFWHVIGEILAQSGPVPMTPSTRAVMLNYDGAFWQATGSLTADFRAILANAARQSQAVVDEYWAGRR
jgi:multiple sugar transport system substrate-binding protein